MPDLKISQLTAGVPISTDVIPFVDGATGTTKKALKSDLVGPAGAAATIAVGAVTTGAPGTSVIITNTGSSSAAVFDFTIPRGDVGATGATGPQGIPGSASTIAYYVAASNATAEQKALADYICDGTADNVEIQAAIDALPASGGTVYLSEGAFGITAEIQMFDNATRVVGAGMDATVVTQGTADTNGFHVGNRQASGIMINRAYLGKLTVNLPGTGGNTAAGVLGDGLGTGTKFEDIICNEGGFGLRLKDLDRVEILNCHPSNQRTTGIRCETGLENTWGTVTFINCSAAVSDNNGIAWDFNTASEQGSPNRFDRVTLIGCLFYMTPALTGVSGLKMTVGATSLNLIGCLFENCVHQLDIIGETQINLTGCSWISTGGVATNLVRFQTNNHFATFTDCRFQQATNAFNDVSGFSRIAFYGHNTNQGTITNLFVGSFSSKEGTDTLFAGNAILTSGVDIANYLAVYIATGGVLNFNNGNATITHSANLLTSNVDLVVPDEVYGVGWNGSLEVPTKNALYDKIETMGAGSGTVTTVSVVTANGISGSVATATTTPAITLTLGNITPSRVLVNGASAIGTNPVVILVGAAGDGVVLNATGTNGPQYSLNANGNSLASFALALDTAQYSLLAATGDVIVRASGGTTGRLLFTTQNSSGADIIFATGTSSANDTEKVKITAAGDLRVTTPGNVSTSVLTTDGTQTLTNKRTNPRVVSAASYTTDTGSSLSVATADQFVITAQAGALKFNNPGGTPTEGQKLIVRIKDNGTARALTYDTQFRAMGNALPSTTVISKTLYLGFIFNVTDTKWDLVAVAQEA